MTEQFSRPSADAADQSPSLDQTLDLAGSLAAVEVTDEPAAQAAKISAESAESEQPTAEQKGDQSAKKRVPPQEVIARLIAAWPQAFFSEPRAVKPLTIGVLQQILANRPAEFEGLNSHTIRTGIKFYTSRLSYHYGIVHNTHRITLAGEPAEEVDDKAREYAKAQIVAIKQQRAARQAAQNPTDTPAEAEAGRGVTEDKKPARAKPPRQSRLADGADRTGRVEQAGESSDSRPRRPRRDQARPPRAAKPSAASNQGAAPAAENLSMEEKLARLAQHFGKPD